MDPVKSITVFISLFFALHVTVKAQGSGIGVLTAGPGSQALGLNGAVTAELLGASSVYANPANLAFEKNSSLNAGYTLWIGDLTRTHSAVTFKKGRRAIAFGLLGSVVDHIELRGSRPGPSAGTFSVSFISLAGAYARRIGPLALGVTAQYLREEYYIFHASGYAFNFGMAAELWKQRLRLGAALLNVGAMNELREEASPLPTLFKAGFSLRLCSFRLSEENLPVTIFLKNDIGFPLYRDQIGTNGGADEVYANLAVEFEIAEVVFLRAGYKTGSTERHWSAGTGIRINSVTANYAIVPFTTAFGTAHSLGISYRF